MLGATLACWCRCDTDSAPQAEELSKELGWTMVPGFTASKLLWLLQNEPENYERMEKVTVPTMYPCLAMF